jgi:hypothetical protein
MNLCESEFESLGNLILRENLPLFGWVPLVFYLPSHTS